MESLKQQTKSTIFGWLRKGEKFTGTDNVYLFTSSFWLFSWQLVSFGLLFVTSIAFAHWLPKEEYGLYKYIISLSAIVGAFSLTGMNTAVTQAVARGYEGSLKRSVALQLRWSVLMALATVVLAVYYYHSGNSRIALGSFVAGLLSVVSTSYNTFSAYLNGKKAFKKLSNYSSCITVVSSFALLLTAYLSRNATAMVIVSFVSAALLNAGFYYVCITRLPPNDEVDPTTLSYGKHLSLIGFLKLASQQADKIITFHYLGAGSLAVYSFAVALPDQLRGVFKILPTISLPKLSAREGATLDKPLLVKFAKLTVSVAVIAAAYIVVAPLCYKLLFPQYIESIRYSQLYAGTLPLLIPSMLLLSLMQAQGDVKKQYVYNTVSSVIDITSLMIGIQWGLTGILLSRYVSGVLNLGLILFQLKKK